VGPSGDISYNEPEESSEGRADQEGGDHDSTALCHSCRVAGKEEVEEEEGDDGPVVELVVRATREEVLDGFSGGGEEQGGAGVEVTGLKGGTDGRINRKVSE